MRKHLLNLEAVSKTFANRMVLDKISMSISQGDYHCDWAERCWKVYTA